MAQSAMDRLRVAPKKAIVKEVKEIKLSELEEQVLEFVKVSKFLGTSTVPLYGASTVEIAKAFPTLNSNTLRYTVWSLRKKGLLVDRGVARNVESGKVPVVVWEFAGKEQT